MTTPGASSPARATENFPPHRWRASSWRPPVQRREVGQPRQRNLDQLDVFALAALLGELGAARMLSSWSQSGHGGLRGRHFAMLAELSPGALTVGQLSRSLNITQQAASKTLGELARMGYVEQSGDVEDRRRRPTSLSPSGREVLDAGLAARAELAGELLSGDVDSVAASIRGMVERGESQVTRSEALAARAG